MDSAAHARALDALREAGSTHVRVLAPVGAPFVSDHAPAACRDADGTVYPVERAEREKPLPHAPDCLCVYAPNTPLPSPR